MEQKKYKILIFSIFIIGVILFSKVDAITNDLPLLGRVIFVDPGHGGYLYPQRIELC